MRHPLLFVCLTAAGALALVGCATPPSGGDQTLQGNWQLADFRLANSAQTRLVGLEPFSMNLEPDGEVTGRLNCNIWRGAYTTDSNATLSLHDLVLIRGRCGTEVTAIEQIEREFPEIFAGESRYRIEGGEMILETERGDRLRFQATHRGGG